MSKPKYTLAEVCVKNVSQYSPSWREDKLNTDERAVRWFGARVRDYIKAETGWAVDSNSATYRKAKAQLDRMVRDGQAVSWKQGEGAYVFYWPVGLAVTLNA